MHGRYLSASWPLDRRGGARPHGGTAGGPIRDFEAAARNRRAPVRQHQAMDEPRHLSPPRAGEGTGRIQPDGAGLQFHPRGEHRGRREPPQSGMKEGGRLPPVTPEDTLCTLAKLTVCHAAPGNGDHSPGADTVKCHSPERFHTVWDIFETKTRERTVAPAAISELAHPPAIGEWCAPNYR